MQTDIFSLPGKFWRGNLHTHSTRSDGVLSLQKYAVAIKPKATILLR